MTEREAIDEEIKQLAIRLWRLMRMVEVVMEDIELASEKLDNLKQNNDNGKRTV